MDDDGHGNPVHLKVKVTITRGRILAILPAAIRRWRAASTQARQPHMRASGDLYVVFGPELAVNDGVVRAVEDYL